MGLIKNDSPLKENLEQGSSGGKPQEEPKKHFTDFGNVFENQQQQQSTSDPGQDVANSRTVLFNALEHSYSKNEFHTLNSSFSYCYQEADPLFIPPSSQAHAEIETVKEYYVDENGFVKECQLENGENSVLKMAAIDKRKNVDQEMTHEDIKPKKMKHQSKSVDPTVIGIKSQAAETSEFSSLQTRRDSKNTITKKKNIESVSSAPDGSRLVNALANQILSKPALLSRLAFDSAEDYAVYVRDRVAIGMRVRCCLGFARNRSKLQNGDTGVVVHLDRNGQLFDRNVEVKWNNPSRNWKSKLRVQFIQIELLPDEEKMIVEKPKKSSASNRTGAKPKPSAVTQGVIAKSSVAPVVHVRLIAQNNNDQDNSDEPTPITASKTVSEKKAVPIAKMPSSSKPVATKLGIQAPNQTPTRPNILNKIIPPSTAIPQQIIAPSLPIASDNGMRYLIPTNQLAELQQKLQQQFPGFNGTVTITSIKPTNASNSSVPPLLIVPKSKPLVLSPTSSVHQQQPLEECSKSTAPTSFGTAQNGSLPDQAGNHICLSNPAKPLSIIIKKENNPQPLRKPVKKENAQVIVLPTSSNDGLNTMKEKRTDEDQELDKVIKKQKYAELFGLCILKNFNEEQAGRFHQLVLEEDLNLNCIDAKGRSPLLLLCSFNQSKELHRYIEILLRRNTVNINWKDKTNCNALVNLSLYYRGNTLMDIFRLLISRGIDVNSCNNNRWNALRILTATYYGSDLIDLIRLLVEHNAKDNKGWGVHYLCNRGFTYESEIVKILQ